MPSRSKNMVSFVYTCYIQCLLIVIIWNWRLLGTFQIVDSQTHRLLENRTQGRHSHFAISQCSPVLWISSSKWTVYRWVEVRFLLTAEETRGFNIISSKLQCLELPWMWLPDTFIPLWSICSSQKQDWVSRMSGYSIIQLTSLNLSFLSLWP